jgi:hypothetical protein
MLARQDRGHYCDDVRRLPTFRFSGANLPSRVVAARSLMCHLAATIVARGHLPSLEVCLRWLRVWLPESDGLPLIGATRVCQLNGVT